MSHSCPYINHPGSVAFLEVKKHGGFVQMRQQGHVLYLVKLGWVHWPNVIHMHCDNLKYDFKKIHCKKNDR